MQLVDLKANNGYSHTSERSQGGMTYEYWYNNFFSDNEIYFVAQFSTMCAALPWQPQDKKFFMLGSKSSPA